MRGDEGQRGEIRWGWAAKALSRNYARSARVDIRLDAATIPDLHDDIRLTPVGHQLLAWWHEARGDNPMPSPDDVSPKTLRQLLPYIRYLSWEGPTSMLYRIFGSALAEVSGVDLTGADLYGDEDYPGRTTDIARMKMLHRTPCGVVMIRELPGRDGIQYPCEMMTLPIAPGADGKQRVIGTVMPTEINESIWTKKIDLPIGLNLLRSVFIDVGFGRPDLALGMEV